VFQSLNKGGYRQSTRYRTQVTIAIILKCLSRHKVYKGLLLSVKLHPYVVFLPAEQKDKILSAIFGSKAGVDVLRFSLKQGIAKKIYQKDLVKRLNYSNKTIIENLKTLTKLGVLTEDMEKNEKQGRTIWVKAYQLTDLGRWFALLLAEEKELTEKEKSEILQSLFRTYVKLVKDLAEELDINKNKLEAIFKEEMKQP
jgi:DNA-binding HxlR family transcriptional regulator